MEQSLAIKVGVSGAAQAKRQLDSLNQSVAGTGSAAAKSAGGWQSLSLQFAAVSAVVTGVGAAVAAVTRELLASASALETLQLQAVAITGSQEAARQVLEESAQIANTYSQSIETVTQGYLDFARVTSSLDVARDITESLAVSMRAVGTSTEQAKSATLALTQALAEGALTGENLRQLINAGTTLDDTFRQLFGINIGNANEMTKKLAAMGIQLEELVRIAAAEDAWKNLDTAREAAGGYAAAVADLKLQWDLLKAALGSTLTGPAAEAIRGLAVLVLAAKDAVVDAKKAAEDWALSLAKVLQFLPGIGDLIKAVGLFQKLGQGRIAQARAEIDALEKKLAAERDANLARAEEIKRAVAASAAAEKAEKEKKKAAQDASQAAADAAKAQQQFMQQAAEQARTIRDRMQAEEERQRQVQADAWEAYYDRLNEAARQFEENRKKALSEEAARANLLVDLAREMGLSADVVRRAQEDAIRAQAVNAAAQGDVNAGLQEQVALLRLARETQEAAAEQQKKADEEHRRAIQEQRSLQAERAGLFAEWARLTKQGTQAILEYEWRRVDAALALAVAQGDQNALLKAQLDLIRLAQEAQPDLQAQRLGQQWLAQRGPAREAEVGALAGRSRWLARRWRSELMARDVALAPHVGARILKEQVAERDRWFEQQIEQSFRQSRRGMSRYLP